MARRSVNRPSHRYEELLGRSMAVCVHPFIAWRLAGRRIHLVIVAGYFAAGYVSILTLLLALK